MPRKVFHLYRLEADFIRGEPLQVEPRHEVLGFRFVLLLQRGRYEIMESKDGMD